MFNVSPIHQSLILPDTPNHYREHGDSFISCTLELLLSPLPTPRKQFIDSLKTFRRCSFRGEAKTVFPTLAVTIFFSGESWSRHVNTRKISVFMLLVYLEVKLPGTPCSTRPNNKQTRQEKLSDFFVPGRLTASSRLYAHQRQRVNSINLILLISGKVLFLME